jgi:hypothetical protein
MAFLTITAANIMIMGVCRYRALELSKMPDKNSLTLHRRSFLVGGSDIVSGLCAHIGGQYYDDGLMLSRSPVIIQNALPEIGDALLTLISRMGQQAYLLAFYI